MWRAVRSLWLPPWRRAPLLALRNASLFLGVAVAAFVLGLAGGSRPMLASSAATETLRRDVEIGCRFDVGLHVERRASVGIPGAVLPEVAEGTKILDAAVGTTPGIGPAVVTVDGGIARVIGEASADETTAPGRAVQLFARTDAEDHIRVLEEGPEPGIWLPDVVAAEVDVRPGDQVNLAIENALVPVPVAGVFRDLRAGRDRHWCSMRIVIEGRGTNPPPPLALLDQEPLLGILEAAGIGSANTTWEYAPTGDDWVLPRAQNAVTTLTRIAQSSNNRSDPLGRELGPGGSRADVVGSVRRAQRTATSVESVAGPVALGTVGVAVVMLLAAARSWIQRRSQEVTVLALRGAGPGALAAKAILELLPPMLLGAVAGLAGAVAVVRVVGPGPQIETAAVVEGAGFVAVALLAALGAAGAVVATRARGVAVAAGDGQAVSRSRQLWWELPVLVLAGAAFYEMRTRDGPIVEDTQVDGLLLLFPLLLLAGGAGLLARMVLAPRPRWASVAGRLPTPAWLAARRLTAARGRAALIVTGAAVSIGIVVFAGSISSSTRATSYAKTTLGHGSAQVVRLRDPVPLPDVASIQGISTLVTRTTETGVLGRGHDKADVLGVEPETFAHAAFWDPSFADRSLDDLLASLEPTSATEAVPVIAVGDGLPDEFELVLSGADGDVAIPVAVADRAEAFPGYGYQARRPLVVLDRDQLTRRGIVELPEIWVDNPSPTIADDLTTADVPILFSVRPAEGIEGSVLQSQSWAVDYLEVVGVAAGLVTVSGLGLYFAANATRRRLGAAFARRLGLPTRSSVLATGLEVTGILFAGFVFGTALAWVAARLVFRDLDPLPNTPPEALFRVDLTLVALSATGALLTSLVVAALVERRSAGASLPELLRDDR